MLIKLTHEHLPIISDYIEQFHDDVIYLMKPVELFATGDAKGVFYGAIENNQLLGLFYFSNKSVLAFHTLSPKVLGSLDFLKSIKAHKPKFIKANQAMIDGVYKLICRAVSEITESKSTLMYYEGGPTPIESLEGFDLISGKHALVDELLGDLKFFIDVESHFGRQSKAINDIVKTFKAMIEEENYLLVVKDREMVAQGLIEDETEKMGILSGIYVSPKYRKLGLGECVSRELTCRLVSRDKRAVLFVKNNNSNARRLYEKIGYKSIKQYAVLTISY